MSKFPLWAKLLIFSSFLLVVVVFSNFVFAASSYKDKVIYDIPYCYNVSISYETIKGNYADVHFKDCTFKDKLWLCDCKDKKNFSIVLQSETSKVNYINDSWYRLFISYNTYDISSFDDKIVVKDYGSYIDLYDSSPKKSDVYCGNITERVVYKNNTVYVDKFVDRIVNNTVFVNDCSAYSPIISDLEVSRQSFNESSLFFEHKVSRLRAYNIFLVCLCALLAIMLIVNIRRYS